MTATRGTSNGNANGNTVDRARRRAWLVGTYRADVDAAIFWNQGVAFLSPVTLGHGMIACRCYRCGLLLIDCTGGGLRADVPAHHVTVDRIVPGKHGGTYRRNNIRPACGGCNSETGGKLSRDPRG